MRAFILPVAVILSLGAASLALASTTTDGVIKSFDMKTHTLVLADGVSYVLPNGFKDPGLKIGEKVAITWDMKGKVYEATAVTILKS